MSKFHSVMHRIQAGAEVKIILDAYGQKQVEMSRAWLPVRKVIRLRRDEISMVEVALNARPNYGMSGATVKV